MAIEIHKLGEGSYEIVGSNGQKLSLDQEQFEDIFYAIPEQVGSYKNETEFFRHLTDNICSDQAQRDTVNAMLDAEPDKVVALQQIQDKVREIGT